MRKSSSATCSNRAWPAPSNGRRYRLALQAGLLLAAGTALSAAADPEFDYLLHCGGCHLEDGAGDPPIVPDLTQSLGHLSTMPRGRAYLTQVPGSSQAPLNNAELAAVLNWMLDRYAGAARGAPFTADEIASYRKDALLDPLKVRAQLLSSD